MVEGGHDPEFNITDESDEEATPAFANLADLERHLPLTAPRGDPWSFPAEQPKKQHKRGVRARKKAQADRERKAM